MTASPPDALHVLIATPFGKHGKGGIDRMMDLVREQVRQNPECGVELRFLTTRGTGPVFLSIFVYFLPSVLSMIYYAFAWRIDVFHVNIVQYGSTIRKLALCYVARMLKIPYVLHLHGSRYREYWSSVGPVLSRRIQGVFNRAAQVLVLGRIWSEFIASQAPKARISVLPNATVAPAQARTHASNGQPIHILFLGQIGDRKGVPELVKALAQLGPSPSWRATLAGDGQVEFVEKQLAALGLADQVTVPGWAGPDDVERLLASADILVLPSHNENLPLSVIEGMAYGLAVVTTPVGAVPDIIVDGETGLLCPPGDAVQLAEALQRVVDDVVLRAKLGRSARAFHAENLNVDTYLSKLISLWRNAALRK